MVPYFHFFTLKYIYIFSLNSANFKQLPNITLMKMTCHMERIYLSVSITSYSMCQADRTVFTISSLTSTKSSAYHPWFCTFAAEGCAPSNALTRHTLQTHFWWRIKAQNNWHLLQVSLFQFLSCLLWFWQCVTQCGLVIWHQQTFPNWTHWGKSFLILPKSSMQAISKNSSVAAYRWTSQVKQFWRTSLFLHQ